MNQLQQEILKMAKLNIQGQTQCQVM